MEYGAVDVEGTEEYEEPESTREVREITLGIRKTLVGLISRVLSMYTYSPREGTKAAASVVRGLWGTSMSASETKSILVEAGSCACFR